MFSVKTLVITAVLAFGSLTPALATPISINVHGVSIPGDNSAIDIVPAVYSRARSLSALEEDLSKKSSIDAKKRADGDPVVTSHYDEKSETVTFTADIVPFHVRGTVDLPLSDVEGTLTADSPDPNLPLTAFNGNIASGNEVRSNFDAPPAKGTIRLYAEYSYDDKDPGDLLYIDLDGVNQGQEFHYKRVRIANLPEVSDDIPE